MSTITLTEFALKALINSSNAASMHTLPDLAEIEDLRRVLIRHGHNPSDLRYLATPAMWRHLLLLKNPQGWALVQFGGRQDQPDLLLGSPIEVVGLGDRETVLSCYDPSALTRIQPVATYSGGLLHQDDLLADYAFTIGSLRLDAIVGGKPAQPEPEPRIGTIRSRRSPLADPE